MLKEKLTKMLEEKQAARAKAMETMAATDDKELRSAQLDLINGIDKEIRSITDMIAEADAAASTDPAAEEDPTARAANLEDPELTKRANMMPVGDLEKVGRATALEEQQKEIEKRGADLRAGKEITVRAVSTGSGVLIEKKYSREIAPHHNEVSTLIDSVHSVPLQGGESYSKAFAVSGGEGDYTGEGADAADADPEMDFVEIGKAKITAYAEVTEEIKALPNVDYVTYVEGEVRKAIRKKITRQIIIGAGTANTLSGIYNAPANVVPTDSDLEVSAIDADTLNDIVFAYGGDEDVEDEAVLVLSKKDLRAFSRVRFEDGRKAYKITKHGNTGTIEEADGGVSVDYIINSACKSLSAADVAANSYTMVYGRPEAYELPNFSELTIKEDGSYRFKQGNIAFRGVVFAGGSVAAYKGWMRVKKVAAAG